MEFNHEEFDVIFITTFIDREYIDKFILSVVESNLYIKLLVVVVCQKGQIVDYKNTFKTKIKTITIDDIKGISEVRNIGLKYIRNNDIKSTYIMFPDDDSSYDSTFFKNYVNIDKSQNYIIDVICLDTKKTFIDQHLCDGSSFFVNNWNTVCSVNMMLKYELVINVGFFDENLGVGAKYGSSEDNDYYIRSCNYCNNFIYNKKLYNYHPSPKQIYQNMSLPQLIKRFESYGRGVIYCLCKHSRLLEALYVCMRALGGSLIFFIKGHFKISFAYFYSFISRLKLVMFLLFYNNKSN